MTALWWLSFTGYDAETGEARPFFIEFFVCNPASGKSHPVFGQLPENMEKGIKPSYLMVKVGSWGRDATQLHRFFGCKKARVDMGCPFSIEAGDCVMSETFTKGSVEVSVNDSFDHSEWMCQSGSMSWNLSIGKKTAFNVGYGAGKLFRKLQLFEMFWHAEGMATAYQGYVMWNGRKYVVRPEDCYGYADKNWGRDFTSPWVWLSSNNLTSEITGRRLTDSVFDIGGGRPKCGPIVLYHKGKLLDRIHAENIGCEWGEYDT